MKRKWAEVRNDYTDDEGFIHIDAWRTGNDDEEGRTIARVRPSGIVDYIDYDAMTDELAKEVIAEAVAINSEQYEKEQKKTATDRLKDLWDKMKEEGKCADYVNEMCTQLKLLGTESNTLTKQMIHDKLEVVVSEIKLSLEP